MFSSVSASEFVPLIIALLAAGALTGFLAGLLGIGGGGVVVPVLYEILRVAGVSDELRIPLCVGTSLAIIVPTSLRSFRSQWRRGAVDPAVLRKLGPWVAAGAILGLFLAPFTPARVLKGLLAASNLFIALRVAFGNGPKSAIKALPGVPYDAAAGLGIGLISTLIGIGGGVYISAYMTLFGWPIHVAVGTASGFGPIIAVPAVVGYVLEGWGKAGLPLLSLGFVNILAAAVVAPVSVLAAPLGVRLAHKLSRRQLEWAFLAFLLSVAARFLASLIWGV